MKNPEPVGAVGVLKNSIQHPNVTERPQKSNPPEDLARRDAAAMIHILNRLRSGLEPYGKIYESLKRLHGPDFDRYFRDQLTNQGGNHES